MKLYRQYTVPICINSSSETQGQLVGWKGFSWGEILLQERSCSKLWPVEIPSTRLVDPESPRMVLTIHFMYFASLDETVHPNTRKSVSSNFQIPRNTGGASSREENTREMSP